jgi:hypothetical protein
MIETIFIYQLIGGFLLFFGAELFLRSEEEQILAYYVARICLFCSGYLLVASIILGFTQ